jgi:putative flippase GtrA
MTDLKFMRRANPGLFSHFLAFAKFGLVGATTAAIYFAVLWFFDSILGSKYIASVSVAYAVSTGFHFLANRHFTFAATQGRQHGQFIRYMGLWFINYLITILVVGFSVEQLLLSPYIGVCVAVLFTMCTGYVLARYWVFKVKEDVV